MISNNVIYVLMEMQHATCIFHKRHMLCTIDIFYEWNDW
jgi:hypothetical protein